MAAQTKHQKPLTVDQILVVTFTEAATAELRDRIRARIHDVRLAFSRGKSTDPVTAPLLNPVDDHRQAAEILYKPKGKWMKQQFLPFTVSVRECSPKCI